MIALGNAYFLSSDPGNAEPHYREAVRLSAAGKKSELLDAAVYRLGLLYLFENDLGKAKRLIDTEGRQLDSCRLTILKGFYTSLKGDSDGALKIYRGVLPLTRGDDTVVVLTLTGDALREKGMWDEAIENYRRAVAMDTGFPAAYYGMGMAYLGKEDIPKADENISMTLSLQPDHVLALSDKADILLMRREPSRALEYTKKSLSQSPPFYRPYLTMGSVLIVLGRDGEAAEYYRLAKERKAPDYMVSLSIARAYSLKGDTAKAREHLSELKRYPLPENVRRLLQ
jgi:tetratricopeptide (TPR) repeat protein